MGLHSDRYKRQIILDEIGPDGQHKINQASVLCIGAGGLGSPALLYLAAAGIGRIGIADFDTVDETNLQRQVLFDSGQTGLMKTQAAQEKMRALNPDIIVETYPEGLTAQNAQTLFERYDIILDGSDNFETKYLASDAGVKFGKPVIYGALSQFEGHVCVFDSRHGPCYRCLYPAAPKEQILNCAEAGILGPVAGIIGTTQALQALMLIIGDPSFSPLIGKLWTLNTKTMESRILNIPKNPDCPACAEEPETIKLSFTAPVCTTRFDLTPLQAAEQTDALFVDVREDYEWEAGHIEDATHAALSAMMAGYIPDLPHDRSLILYCQHGVRSKQAAEILKTKGYTALHHINGGYAAWLAYNG